MISVFVQLCLALLIVVIVSYIIVLRKVLCKASVVTASPSDHTKKVIRKYRQAPGPKPWPIIGNLDLLAKYQNNPFAAFTALTEKYGDIYTLTLGSTRCLVVNNLELIREVLNQNGKFFGGRPDFLRYHKLFGGDRNNSLALCDWSQLQQKRRNLARRHCSPRESSSYFTKMSGIGTMEASELMDKLDMSLVPGEPFDIKPLIQQTCANMFSQYMCSTRFNYEDADFQLMVKNFDEIFWEINQGYPLDFMPWLAPVYKRYTDKIVNWSTEIREFILNRVINDRELNIDLDEPDNDFTDALLKSLIEDKNLSRNTIIYMLEDFIGGHSAVGNLVMLALAYCVKNPEIAARIQTEVDAISNNGARRINLYDMETMSYTMATIFEVLRYSSSPIVPHVATEDAVISGHGVTAGTVVFINNYILNTSDKYWEHPEHFDPTRFLELDPNTKITTNAQPKFDFNIKNNNQKRRNSEGSDSGIEFEKETIICTSNSESTIFETKIGNDDYTAATATTAAATTTTTTMMQKTPSMQKYNLRKNIPHFLPFSIGKRTCIGQNLVRGFGFILLANILQRYNVGTKDLSSITMTPACMALPANTFPLVFTPRK